jgi:thioredoxin 1
MKEILKFSRVGCSPCRTMSLFLNDKGVEYKELDVEEDVHLASQYGIGSVPTLLLIEDGEMLDMVVGFKPNSVEELLSKM